MALASNALVFCSLAVTCVAAALTPEPLRANGSCDCLFVGDEALCLGTHDLAGPRQRLPPGDELEHVRGIVELRRIATLDRLPRQRRLPVHQEAVHAPRGAPSLVDRPHHERLAA